MIQRSEKLSNILGSEKNNIIKNVHNIQSNLQI